METPGPTVPTTTMSSCTVLSYYNLDENDEVIITSPNYPNNYENNLDCQWQVSTIDGAGLYLLFTDFQTENGYDFLVIRDSDNTNSGNLNYQLTGSSLPDPFTMFISTIWLSFHSDSSVVAKGFRLVLTSTPIRATEIPIMNENCQSIINLRADQEVIIASPNFPENYGNFEDCLWLISTLNGMRIHIDFIEFDTEGVYDTLRIGTGSDPNVDVMTNLSGSTLPGNIISDSNDVWLKFTSDGSVTRAGFQILVRSTTAGTTWS